MVGMIQEMTVPGMIATGTGGATGVGIAVMITVTTIMVAVPSGGAVAIATGASFAGMTTTASNQVSAYITPTAITEMAATISRTG